MDGILEILNQINWGPCQMDLWAGGLFLLLLVFHILISVHNRKVKKAEREGRL